MGLFDGIEKFITEHGSAAILVQQLSFAKEQFAALEKKVGELQTENGRLQARLERVGVDLHDTQMELQRLQKEHEEEVRVHRCIEFRRGKRTGNKWVAFCPKCHMPAFSRESVIFVTCTDPACKWSARLENITLSQIIIELGA
ncbi:MAG: hypothetical protein ABSH38_09330 [Verrucomicrobiota bacterium]|jgi:hypothetical protein